MAVAAPTRHRIGVTCVRCGTVVLVYLTVTPLPSPRGELRLRTKVDPDDMVMTELFQEQHHGPFRPLGPR